MILFGVWNNDKTFDWLIRLFLLFFSSNPGVPSGWSHCDVELDNLLDQRGSHSCQGQSRSHNCTHHAHSRHPEHGSERETRQQVLTHLTHYIPKTLTHAPMYNITTDLKYFPIDQLVVRSNPTLVMVGGVPESSYSSKCGDMDNITLPHGWSCIEQDRGFIKMYNITDFVNFLPLLQGGERFARR